jgi:hypothetical protein
VLALVATPSRLWMAAKLGMLLAGVGLVGLGAVPGGLRWGREIYPSPKAKTSA